MATIHTNDKATLAAMTAVFGAAIAYGAADSGAVFPLALGAVIFIAAVVVARWREGRHGSPCALPVLGMCMVALLIHAARGRPLAHFAVFGFLACTIVYRDWRAVVAAAATIAVHHLSFNCLQAWRYGPICFTEPSLLTVFEHAAYVVVQSGLLIVLSVRAHRDAAASEQLAGVAQKLLTADARADFAAATANAHVSDTTARKLIDALKHIERSIAQVNTSSQSISIASREIASGNMDLSHRTEQAAISLQQTASSMQQLTANVRQNAEAAVQANRLAVSAADVAQRGGGVVAQVVSLMDQTNIPALNAAVEAARAGEPGRGFAVVATEVRSLVQRSAAAAREIKTLIGASVERVEAGTRQVADAGSTMTEIVASVQRVSHIIHAISTATAAQSTGLDQVNTSVGDLDRMTQQNAALVEQSAAAESLKEQAVRLGDLVSTFRLEAELHAA